MLEIVHGDLLAAPTEALVNAVNTVGVMSKGLTLQFREAWADWIGKSFSRESNGH